MGGREGVQTDARNKYMRTGDGAVDTGLQIEEHAHVHNALSDRQIIPAASC